MRRRDRCNVGSRSRPRHCEKVLLPESCTPPAKSLHVTTWLSPTVHQQNAYQEADQLGYDAVRQREIVACMFL
jgi:hypothetical protein